MKLLIVVLVGHVVGELIRRIVKKDSNIDTVKRDDIIFHPAEFQLRYDPLRD